MQPLTSFNYSIPYLIFTLILVIIYFLFRAKSINLKFKSFEKRVLLVTLFTLFWGFRGYICTDWINYYVDFIECPPLYDFDKWLIFYHSNFLDIGFLIYIGLLKILISNYLIFQLITYLILIVMIDKCINEYSSDYILSYILLIVFFTVQSINTIRNGISIMLFMLSIKFISKHNIKKYLFYILLAICFHKTALIFIPLYFFIKYKFRIKYIIVFFIFAYIIMLFQISFISEIAENIIQDTSGRVNYALQYIKNTSFRIFSIGNIERFITLIVLLCNYNKLWKEYRYGGYFANIMILYLSSNLLLFEISTVATRISQLFSFAYIIFYPMILDIYTKKNYINLIRFSLISYVFAWCVLTFSQLMYEYDNFILNTHKSYEQRMVLYNYYGPAKYVGF